MTHEPTSHDPNLTEPTVLRFPAGWLWIFGIVGVAAGCGIGFAIGPVGRWAVDTLPSLPGPLEIAMTVPAVWLVPVASVLGFVGGLALFDIARKESLTLTVAADHVELSQDGREQYVPRTRIGAVFREDDDLVLTDRNRRPLARFGAGDLSGPRMETVFRERGYPWIERNDPLATEYTKWMDGAPGLDEAVHTLLRARRRAFADKKARDVEEIDEKLAELGVSVRDRKDEQQVRVLARRD